MTQNLALVGPKNLNSIDSDIASGSFNLPSPSGSGSWSDSYWWDIHNYIIPGYEENGAYYSWHTAIADSGHQGRNQTDKEAPKSICPKGWKLPTSNQAKAFLRAYNNSPPNEEPVKLSRFGAYYGGQQSQPSNAGQDLYLWTSTFQYYSSRDWDFPYSLYANSGGFYVAMNGGAGYGYNIRCLSNK